MGSISSAFASLYLFFGAIALVSVLMRLTLEASAGQRLLSTVLVVPLVCLYLVGMHRSAGLDYDTYLAAYNDEGLPIPDLGYAALTWLTQRLGVRFSEFLLLQGIFTLWALRIASKAFGADLVVVLVIYLLHLAIVRDMSQSRIGLAVAVYLLGQTQQRSVPKLLLYLAAASIHITVLVLMFIWAYVKLSSRFGRVGQILGVYLPAAAFAAGGVVLLQAFAWADPRIEIYLSWEEASYGAPLESYGALLRTALVVGVYLAASRKFPKLSLRNYIVLELVGAAILIGFSQFSVFAARLSNVAVSMYPFGLGIVASAYRSRWPSHHRRRLGWAVSLSVAATMATLLARPGSYEALAEVKPRIFEYMVD